jgi:type IV secretory pathway ATPase VirB11/archaellum biosynthesis ATPase
MPASRPGLVSEELRRAVALVVREARSHAEVIALAQQYAEPIAPSDEPVLSCEAFDRLLDPLTPTEERFRLFRRLLTDAVAHDQIAGVTHAHLADDAWVQHLFDETLSWGEAGRLLLTDERIAALIISGAEAHLRGPGVEAIPPEPYATSRIPLSRAEFLVLATGGHWNRSTPCTSITLRSGTRVLLAREPVVRSRVPGQPGFAAVVQRGAGAPWTLDALIAHGVLDRPSAALLTAMLHARCAILVSGPPGTGTMAVVEALLHTLPSDQITLLLGVPPGSDQGAADSGTYQLHLAADAPPELLRTFLATFADACVIDRLVAHVVHAATAETALDLVSAGVPALLSIAAGSPDAAVHRLARFADAAHHQFDQALWEAGTDITHSVHAHVHLEYAGRGLPGYVGEVRLLTQVPDQRRPVLVPVVTADPGPDGISWSHHGRIRDRELVLYAADHAAPPVLHHHLANVPEDIWEQWTAHPLGRPAPLAADPRRRTYLQLQRRARAAFDAGDVATAAQLLAEAAATQPAASLDVLADTLLTAAGTLELLDREIAATVATVSAALDAGQVAQALALLAAPANVLVTRRRAATLAWQDLIQRAETVMAALDACEQTLRDAQTARDRGDLHGAYHLVRSLVAAQLPPAAQRAVLQVRHTILSRLIAQLQEAAEGQQVYAAELAQVTRELDVVEHRSGATTLDEAPGDPGATSAPSTTRWDTAAELAGTPAAREDEQLGASGWLDTALARNRERLRQPQRERTASE